MRVKIYCISSIEEANLAVRLGASALGLVSEMPSGPGVIADSRIAEISATVPPPIGTFLFTSQIDAEAIVAQQECCGVNGVQVCDRLPVGELRTLRKSLPGISLVRVIHVVDEALVAEAVKVGGEVDALLLDSGNQSLPIKELGGTGQVHDWALSARSLRSRRVQCFLPAG